MRAVQGDSGTFGCLANQTPLPRFLQREPEWLFGFTNKNKNINTTK
jgi:hypothetical protein